MENNEKLKELSNLIKNARKYSLIGEYGNSLEKYQEAIGIIKERQKELNNESEDLKEKWKMTEYNIKSEMLQIKDILETCIQLHHSHFNYSKKQLEGYEFINENKKIIEKEIMEIYNKDKRIYEKSNRSINDNKNKNNSYSNKTYKPKSNYNKNNINLMINIKKTKTPKGNPWPNKNTFNNKYSKLHSNNDNNNFNIKKCKSLKNNTIEKKMFNPLEVFYGIKTDEKDNNKINNKELKINGKDNFDIHRKSEIIQQKINMQKITPFSMSMKLNVKNISYNKNLVQNKISSTNNSINESNKKIKVVQIDLDDAKQNKIINDFDKKEIIENKENKEIKENKENEENYDMVEQALKNLSQLNIDNNDDSF